MLLECAVQLLPKSFTVHAQSLIQTKKPASNDATKDKFLEETIQWLSKANKLLSSSLGSANSKRAWELNQSCHNKKAKRLRDLLKEKE